MKNTEKYFYYTWLILISPSFELVLNHTAWITIMTYIHNYNIM